MQIVAVAPNQWDGQWMNRQHLMWAVKDRASVLYVQEPEPWHHSWKPRDERFLRGAIESKASSLSLLRLPKALCRRGRQGGWNDVADRCKARIINRAAGEHASRRLFYFWHPELFSYLNLVDHDISIFHIYDRVPEYYEPAFSHTPIYKAFREACRRADVIVAGTSEQADIVPNRDVTILPNAVAYENYVGELPSPADMVDIPRPRVGYVGSISHKLDLSWFDVIANDGQAHVVLIGPIGNMSEKDAVELKQLCAHDRVHYLGAKTAAELPAYLKALDVGLMNYRRGLHCEAGSPLKLFEYAAAGIPIVAARTAVMSGSKEFSDLVTFADTPTQAALAVQQALRDDLDRSHFQNRLKFAQKNSWKHRATQILSLAGMATKETDSPSSSYEKQPQSVTI